MKKVTNSGNRKAYWMAFASMNGELVYLTDIQWKKTKLIRYAGEKGKTRIVIEYDSDTGKGWLRAVNEYPEEYAARIKAIGETKTKELISELRRRGVKVG